MLHKKITLTTDFRKQATKAVFSIISFILVYLMLIVLALALTALCVWGGFLLITAKPSFLTLVLGIGLASLGVLVLIFLVKFIFKSNKIDRSHLVEITSDEEPALFKMIDELVREVGTSFPKKIYLSADVNAAVFYDSSFWSMVFPVRKNLQIGMGLVNTLTLDELRGVLAHEFGHFSQRSMKVGSYVYNVNQVIYNMLYDNESYDGIVQSWANISGYFVPFINGAIKIIVSIQWVLRKMYGLVNLSYMGLSREMEFHADEIAAHVTGYQPLSSALLRMELAQQSYSSVIDFYSERISENVKSPNIYREQARVMQLTATEKQLPIVNGLPQIDLRELQKFNKSKLVVKDQWASHPGTDERIHRLEKTRLVKENGEPKPASHIFSDIEQTERKLTEQLFRGVDYKTGTKILQPGEFETAYMAQQQRQSLDKLYNGYYDHKNPLPFDVHVRAVAKPEKDLAALFSTDKVELVYTAIALQNDLAVITQIGTKEYPVRTFDYDGEKYKQKDAFGLAAILKKELEGINEKILANDRYIFQYFQFVEKASGNERRLQDYYDAFFGYEKANESKFELCSELVNATQFIYQTTPFEVINSKLKIVTGMETGLKGYIKEMLDDKSFHEEITPDIRQSLELYLSKNWDYIVEEHYIEYSLQVFFTALNHYSYLLSRGYFIRKKQLLEYQASLVKVEVSTTA